MDLTSYFLGEHPEPPVWLDNLMARGALARRVYRHAVITPDRLNSFLISRLNAARPGTW
jgi:hypothetical protein